MQYIRNYLSRVQGQNRILLLAKEEEFDRLADEIYRLRPTGSVSLYCLEEVKRQDLFVDTILFGKGFAEELKNLSYLKPDFLIGKMEKEEDYFSVWEIYRKCASHIAIERDKDLSAEQIRDGEKPYEVLEWEGTGTEIELSVVIPVYNVGKYLPKCIESLLSWESSYVEYLFVNDGSMDNSRDIIREYGKKDGRVRLLDKENGGCASARNCGLEAARGRYVGFVDSDDFIGKDMFCRLLGRAMMGSYDLAYCGYLEYYQKNHKVKKVLNDCLGDPYLGGTYKPEQVWKLAINTRVAIWRCIYKKSLLDEKKIRFHEDLQRFDDLPFRVECIFSARSAVCVPQHLYYYRLGREGQDVECQDKRLWVHFAIFKHLDNFTMPKKNRRMLDYLQVVKVQTHGYALGRIEKALYRSYQREAKKQLAKTAGKIRTVGLILRYTGRKNLGWYLF